MIVAKSPRRVYERSCLASKTCSARCGYQLRKAASPERVCLRCGKSYRPYPSALARGSRYCSRDCYIAAVGVRPAMVERTCPQCGAVFKRTQAAIRRVRNAYCGSECRTAASVGEGSTSWRGGTDAYRGRNWDKISEQIRERDGRRCRRCGVHESALKQRLSVDHVIPWRTFTDEAAANDPKNLVSLCRPCHSRKGRAERLWLQGDVLDMWRYQLAVAEPWTKDEPKREPRTRARPRRRAAPTTHTHVDPAPGCAECYAAFG